MSRASVVLVRYVPVRHTATAAFFCCCVRGTNVIAGSLRTVDELNITAALLTVLGLSVYEVYETDTKRPVRTTKQFVVLLLLYHQVMCCTVTVW